MLLLIKWTIPTDFEGQLLLEPFAVESLVCRGKKSERKSGSNLSAGFEIPSAWRGKQVSLHFGAVDWKTDVWAELYQGWKSYWRLKKKCTCFGDQKFEKSRFTRVDSDVIDNLIIKEDKKGETLEAGKQEALSAVFKSQLPKLEKVEFNITAQALGENSSPVMITQSEYMRRMKEMANIQAGMSFYGEMPDMFNLVLNSDHKLVKEVLADEEKECDSVIAPFQQ